MPETPPDNPARGRTARLAKALRALAMGGVEAAKFASFRFTGAAVAAATRRVAASL